MHITQHLASSSLVSNPTVKPYHVMITYNYDSRSIRTLRPVLFEMIIMPLNYLIF